MKRLITLGCVLLLPIWAQGAYGQVVIDFSGVDGQAGGQIGDVHVSGGIVFCLMCGLQTPGTSVNPSLSLQYESASGGGIECFTAFNCMLSIDEIQTLRHITLPTNGQAFFTVTVPDVFESGVSGTVLLPDGSTSPFSFGGASGVLVLSFVLVPPGVGPPPGDLYFFQGGEFTSRVATTPEPGSLDLMAAGLAGLLGVALKRRKLLRGVPMNPQVWPFGTDPATSLSAG